MIKDMVWVTRLIMCKELSLHGVGWDHGDGSCFEDDAYVETGPFEMMLRVFVQI